MTSFEVEKIASFYGSMDNDSDQMHGDVLQSTVVADFWESINVAL